MAVTYPTRSRYAAAWAVLLGSVVLLAVSAVAVAIGPASADALLGLWAGFIALQLAVFALLVAIGYRDQRAFWSTAIPVSIVIAQVVSGLCSVLADTPADDAEAAYADVLF